MFSNHLKKNRSRNFIINFKIGWFPDTYIKVLTNLNPKSNSSTTTTTPTSARLPTSMSFNNQPINTIPNSSSSNSLNRSSLVTSMSNGQIASTISSTTKNYFISIYPYVSNEAGDLNFREFEIINVIDKNEDWLTGQIVGSGTDANNPLRSGIFPANFVIKFNIPIEYIGKYTISMATEAYQAQNNGELTVNPGESQLIAVKKISPDAKWSFGESYVGALLIVCGYLCV